MDPAKTAELDFETHTPNLDPSSEEALRAAFHTMPIARQMNFHEAMAIRTWEICIRNTALAAARKQEPKQ